MKNKLLACLLATSCLAIAAPHVGAAPDRVVDDYQVQDGDTLWALSGDRLQDPTRWGSVVEMNPILQQKGRIIRRNGKTVVLLHPGEHLRGLQKLGILPIQTGDVMVAGPSVPRTSWVHRVNDFVDHNRFWLLLGFIACSLAAVYLVNRMLNRDPATARRPQVAGGVNDQTAHEQFVRRGQTQGFDVLEQQRGRIWGILNVRYGDGREVPRRLNGQSAYCARVRYHRNGREEWIYMLQACGNDLRHSGISRYVPGPDFRFVSDRVEEPAPAPAPVVSEAPVAPAPEPEAVPAVPEAGGQEHGPQVVFEYKAATGQQPHMIRLSGVNVDDLTCSVTGDGLTLRYREVPEAQVEPA